MDTKTLCLGALSLGDETGYDIKKRFEESFGHFLEVSPSGIYRALNELENDGAISADYVVQQGRPNKKKLKLTEAGRERFVEALVSSPVRHRVRSEFLFALLHAHQLPAANVSEKIDQHVEEMRQFLHVTEEWLADEGEDAPSGMRFVALFAVDLLNAHMAAIDRHRGILEQDEQTPAKPAARKRPAPVSVKNEETTDV